MSKRLLMGVIAGLAGIAGIYNSAEASSGYDRVAVYFDGYTRIFDGCTVVMDAKRYIVGMAGACAIERTGLPAISQGDTDALVMALMIGDSGSFESTTCRFTGKVDLTPSITQYSVRCPDVVMQSSFDIEIQGSPQPQ